MLKLKALLSLIQRHHPVLNEAAETCACCLLYMRFCLISSEVVMDALVISYSA